MRYIALILSVFILYSQPAYASDLEIGRMRVAIWPEYDSAGVLFIYDGKFKDNGVFPTESSFLLPAGSVISDACSLSPKGQHFCQLYKQKNIGEADEVSMKLPYPNFYLSFHSDPFAASGEKRVLNHTIKANHKIDKLEIDIQSPLRAEGFGISKPEGFEVSDKKGFTHYEKVFEGVEKGQVIEVSIEYSKPDRTPSVDIKYTPMSAPENANAPSPYQRQKSVLVLGYVTAGAGLVLLIGLMYLVFRSKGKKDG